MICFDLDDTLLNTHVRHYRVILDFLRSNHPDLSSDFIDFETYKNLRKSYNFTNYQVLKHLYEQSIERESFLDFFSNQIESLEYLQYDYQIVDINLLQKIKQPLCICSLRSNPENGYKQLNTLQLSKHFTEIHFLKHNSLKNPKKKFFEEQKKITHFIGDSQTDLDSIKETKIKFIGVKTGFYSFSPEIVFDDINQVIQNYLM